jgi:cell division protein FtsB
MSIVPPPGAGSPGNQWITTLEEGMARDIAAWTKAQKALDDQQIGRLQSDITKLEKENKQLKLENLGENDTLASVGYELRPSLLKPPKGVSLQNGVGAEPRTPARTLPAQYAQIKTLTAETSELAREHSYLQRVHTDYVAAIGALEQEGVLPLPAPVMIV